MGFFFSFLDLSAITYDFFSPSHLPNEYLTLMYTVNLVNFEMNRV